MTGDGERLIARFDQGYGPVRYGLAGDSTGDSHLEWFHRGTQKLIDRYPNFAGFLWGGYYINGSSYSRYRLVPIGPDYDEFDGSGYLNGHYSTGGGNWVGEVPDAWTLSGGYAISNSSTYATLTAATPHVGNGRRVSGRFLINTAAPSSERTFNVDFGADASNRMALTVAVSTGGITFAKVSKVINGVVTSNIILINPLTSVTGSGWVEIPFSMEVSPTNVSIYISGNSSGVAISSSDFAALGGMTMLRMRASTMGGVKVDRIGMANIIPNASLVEVWNGSKAGSTLDTQAGNMDALFPQKLDAMFVSSSHNYLDDNEDTYRSRLSTFIDLVTIKHPNAGIVLSSQNPEFAPNPFGFRNAHNLRNVSIRDYADRSGYGYIGATEAFASSGSDMGLSLVDTDGVHPLQAGEDLWGHAFFDWAKNKSLIS